MENLLKPNDIADEQRKREIEDYRRKQTEEIGKELQEEIDIINRENTKNKPDLSTIIGSLDSIFMILSKERRVSPDSAGRKSQAVALSKVIVKKGLELKLSTVWSYYHAITGEFEDSLGKSEISIGDIKDYNSIPGTHPWIENSVLTRFLHTDVNANKKKSALYTWSSANAFRCDSALSGNVTTEDLVTSDNHPKKSITQFYVSFQYNLVKESEWYYLHNEIDENGNEVIKEDNPGIKHIVQKFIIPNYQEWEYFAKARGWNNMFSKHEINYVTERICMVPDLTLDEIDKPLIFYVDDSTFMKTFLGASDFAKYPTLNVLPVDISKTIRKAMGRGTSDPNKKWEVDIRGFSGHYSEFGYLEDKKPVIKTIEYTDEEFRKEGFPLALILSYFESKGKRQADVMDTICKGNNIVPPELTQFSNDNIIIRNGDNKLNHRSISDYDARNIMVDYLRSHGFKEKEVETMIEQIFDNHWGTKSHKKPKDDIEEYYKDEAQALEWSREHQEWLKNTDLEKWYKENGIELSPEDLQRELAHQQLLINTPVERWGELKPVEETDVITK